MISPYEFIKEHPYLCAGTLGIAIIGYMVFRVVQRILHKCHKTQQIDTIAQQTLKPVQTPSLSKKALPARKELHSYKSPLTPAQKADMQSKFLDENTLKISFRQASNVAVTIRRQDLFMSKATVIVNAANTHLGGGGGVDGAIHEQGGDAYAQAHKELQTQYASNYPRGYATMISSGLLRAKYSIENVIVVAGPEGPDTSPDKEKALYSCYYNSLLLAESQHKSSIAFPSISTGLFQFPKEIAANIALQAIYDFITHSSPMHLTTISVHFLPTDPQSDLEIYQKSATT